jgi:hypothetical protein
MTRGDAERFKKMAPALNARAQEPHFAPDYRSINEPVNNLRPFPAGGLPVIVAMLAEMVYGWQRLFISLNLLYLRRFSSCNSRRSWRMFLAGKSPSPFSDRLLGRAPCIRTRLRRLVTGLMENAGLATDSLLEVGFMNQKRFCRLVIAVCMLLLGSAALRQASAQAPKRTPTPNDTLVSPEVLSDRRVTFRIYAPKASEVMLIGDWMEGTGPAKLAKDDKGVWSVTVGPLTPDFYGYEFRLDGVRILDPKNP